MILSACNVPELLKVMKIIKLVITIIKIAVPIALIITCMVDYMKATGEDGEISKVNSIIVKKVIAAIIIFLIPTIVNIFFNIIDPNEKLYISCLDNATTEKINELYVSNMNKYINTAKEQMDYNSYNTAKIYLNNIKDENLANQYKKELDEIKKQIDSKEKQENNENITYNGISPSEFDKKINNMNTPTMDQINQAFKNNNISDDYAIVVMGTTYNEDYANEPYLIYGWASAMINSNFPVEQVHNWPPQGYYSAEHIEEGYENFKNSDIYKKAVYIALTYRDKTISNCYGYNQDLASCITYTSKNQPETIYIYSCFK